MQAIYSYTLPPDRWCHAGADGSNAATTAADDVVVVHAFAAAEDDDDYMTMMTV